MIDRLTGILSECDLTEAVVEIHGVGFSVTVPVSTYDRLPRPGGSVTLFTHLYVREDLLQLYGFATTEERRLFRMLIGVSGVGPRIALNVLSSMTVSGFCRSVSSADLKGLTRVNGLGRKSAERLVMELRDRVTEIDPAAAFGGGEKAIHSAEMIDAVAALETLGFKTDKAKSTVRSVWAKLPEAERSAENLIRTALQQLNS